MEQIITNIAWLLEVFMVEICIHIVWNKKFRFGVFTAALILCNEVIFTLTLYGVVPYSCKFITIILAWILCRFEFKRPFAETIIKFFMAITLAGIVQIISAFVLSPFEDLIKPQAMLLAVVNIISIFIVSIFRKVIHQWENSLLPSVIDKSFLHTMIFCVVSFVIMIIDYSINQELRVIYDIIITVLIILTYKYLLKVRITEKELEKKKLELEMQRIYGDAYKELLDEVRKRQHDFKNQLTAIYSMHLVAETLDDLVEMQKEYCEKLEENIRYDQILTKCNEPILAGFLYYKCITCEKMGVKVDYTISVTSAECQIALHEIIEIIGIFMDNACEQVVELSCDSRTIELSVDDNDGAITIEIGNPSRPLTSREIEQMFQPGFSTKGENRGLGLPRVKQLVKNHNLELIVFNSEKYGRSWLNFKLVIQK